MFNILQNEYERKYTGCSDNAKYTHPRIQFNNNSFESLQIFPISISWNILHNPESTSFKTAQLNSPRITTIRRQ